MLSGDRESIAKLSKDDLLKIVAATMTGMSVDDFQTEVTKWIRQARDARWKRNYTELSYLPMIELMKYLRANGYATYIVVDCRLRWVVPSKAILFARCLA